MSRRTERAVAGHTLLELVVALAVGGLLLTLATTTSTQLDHATGRLATRARDLGELSYVLECLRRDLGGAASARPRERAVLHVKREPVRARALGVFPPAADPGVLYSWADDDGLLVREDLALGTRRVVGRRLRDFRVENLGGLQTEIVLEIDAAPSPRVVSLVWEARS